MNRKYDLNEPPKFGKTQRLVTPQKSSLSHKLCLVNATLAHLNQRFHPNLAIFVCNMDLMVSITTFGPSDGKTRMI